MRFPFGKNAFPLSRVWEMCRNIRESRFSVRSPKERTFLIVTFCGHGKTTLSEEEEQRLIALLQSILSAHPDTRFYLGDYGAFDGACNHILTELQKEYPRLKRIFVTPYISPEYGRLKTAKERYDESIYPFEKRVMPKYAIAKRNEWMVDHADVLIAYVRWNWGGAYHTLDYAKRHNKTIVNIYEE